MKVILEEEGKTHLNLLFKCPDKDVRVCVWKILYTVTERILETEKGKLMSEDREEIEGQIIAKYKSKGIQFLMLLVGNINFECSKCWTKFGEFFKLIGDICKSGGEEMVEFLYSKDVVAILLDFYLGSKSPIWRGEKRYQMGNKFYTADFSALIECVCYLLRHVQPKSAGSQELSSKLGSRSQQMTEEDHKCFYDKDFMIKTLKEGHAPQEMATLLCHFAFESLPFSREISKILLTGINESDYSEIKPYFQVLKPFLCMKDSIQQLRIEWLLGFGSPISNKNYRREEPENQLGLSIIISIKEDVYNYLSPIAYNSYQTDSLLSLLSKYRKRLESHTMNCLKYLLEIMLSDDRVFDHILYSPPPNYCFERYMDWVIAFIRGFGENSRTVSPWAKERKETSEACLKMIEEYLKGVEERREQGLIIYPATYMIGSTVREEVLETVGKEEEGIVIRISQIVTKVHVSEPTGEGNKGVPGNFNEFKLRPAVRRNLALPGMPYAGGIVTGIPGVASGYPVSGDGYPTQNVDTVDQVDEVDVDPDIRVGGAGALDDDELRANLGNIPQRELSDDMEVMHHSEDEGIPELEEGAADADGHRGETALDGSEDKFQTPEGKYDEYTRRVLMGQEMVEDTTQMDYQARMLQLKHGGNGNRQGTYIYIYIYIY